MKPRITIWRNFRGDALWKCIGWSCGKQIISRGRTPAEAYQEWIEDCDFPF